MCYVEAAQKLRRSEQVLLRVRPGIDASFLVCGRHDSQNPSLPLLDLARSAWL
jgi:hypothetical protein